MSAPLPRRTVTFVVRLWAEYLEQTPPAWRGEIKDVESGEKAYFRDVADVVRFITTHVSGAVGRGEEDSQ